MPPRPRRALQPVQDSPEVLDPASAETLGDGSESFSTTRPVDGRHLATSTWRTQVPIPSTRSGEKLTRVKLLTRQRAEWGRCGCCGSELPLANLTALQATPDVMICHACPLWAADRITAP